MFMMEPTRRTDPDPQADPARASAEAGGPPGKARRLIALLGQLIAYGKDLVATLQAQPANLPPPTPLALGFGTLNLALIIARITRGLHLATALRARLYPTALRIHDPFRGPSLPTRSTPRKPGIPRPKPAGMEDDDALLARMPTAAEIARRIRGRPAGSVLADICRDLGILPSHPLWRAIQDAVVLHRGSGFRLAVDMERRVTRGLAPTVPRPLTAPEQSPDDTLEEVPATGPP